DVNESYLALESVSKAPLVANVKTLIQEHGATRDGLVVLKHGDDLFRKTHREEHREGYVVAEINAHEHFVSFTNGIRLSSGDSLAPSRPQIFQAQILETVQQHMEMQERLGGLGIKVLSLFFIDRVANYTSDQGIIRKLFDSAFQTLKDKYSHFRR